MRVRFPPPALRSTRSWGIGRNGPPCLEVKRLPEAAADNAAESAVARIEDHPGLGEVRGESRQVLRRWSQVCRLPDFATRRRDNKETPPSMSWRGLMSGRNAPRQAGQCGRTPRPVTGESSGRSPPVEGSRLLSVATTRYRVGTSFSTPGRGPPQEVTSVPLVPAFSRPPSLSR